MIVEETVSELSIFGPACELGEGLYATKEVVAWVDIIDKKLFILRESRMSVIDAPIVISKVVSISKGEFTLLSENGVATYNQDTKCWSYSNFNFGDRYRSNDGCLLDDGKILIGVMSTVNPARYRGSVWIYDDGKYEKVLGNISIPNTFIRLSESEILITDSLLGEVRRFKFNKNQLEFTGCFYRSDDSSTPDGACLYDGFVYMAFWGGNCLRKFDMNGRLISKILVPFEYPTSVSVSNDWMYVTSATCDLPRNHKRINDGKTLRFKLSETAS